MYIYLYIFIYIYILAIAGQTAGPNRLKYFEETHGYPGRLGVTHFSENHFLIFDF